MTTKYDFLLPHQRPTGIGNNLYILGVSEDGPVYNPVPVSDPSDAARIFGDRNRGTLVKACEQAYEINEEISIYLMRITGKSATLKIGSFLPSGIEDEIISFTSIYGGEKYNAVSIFITHDNSTNARYLNFRLPFQDDVRYLLNEFMNIGHLVNRINTDCRSGIHPILVTSNHLYLGIDVFEACFEVDVKQYLSEGDDGLDNTLDDMYIACETAYQVLLGRNIDLITPANMYIDDVHPLAMYGQATYGDAMYAEDRDYLQLLDTYNNDRVVTFHEQLISFCKEQMGMGFMTHGVIGFRPMTDVPENIEDDDSYIFDLVKTTILRNRYGLAFFKEGDWIDQGYYISIVKDELIYFDGTPQSFHDSGAIGYASAIAGRFDTTTNMKLSPNGNVKLRYSLSELTRAELARFGVVTFRNSIRHGLVVNSGVTAAHWKNEMQNLANLRMVQLSMAYMNDALEDLYEDHLADSMKRQLVDETVKTRLDELQGLGIITEYDYHILDSGNSPLGAVHLQLKTKYTVNAINTSASTISEV